MTFCRDCKRRIPHGTEPPICEGCLEVRDFVNRPRRPAPDPPREYYLVGDVDYRVHRDKPSRDLDDLAAEIKPHR